MVSLVMLKMHLSVEILEHNYTKGYSTYYVDPFLFQNEYFATWQGIIDTDEFNVNQDNSQIIFYLK